MKDKNGLLLAVAIAIGGQIPISLNAIPDPVVKVVLQVVCLVTAIVLATLVKPDEVRRSMFPPPPKSDPDVTPTETPDAKKRRGVF
jgi:hypothetical protein